MSVSVRGSQSRRLDPSVNLRRRDRCVTEKFLDRAQVGAPLQQMRGERVAQRMRMRAGELAARRPPPVAPKGAAAGGRRMSPSGWPDLDRNSVVRGSGAADQRRTASLQIARQGIERMARRPGTTRVLPPLPSTRPPRRRSRRAPRSMTRAPRPAVRTRTRARTARGHATPAASPPESHRAAPRPPPAPGRVAGAAVASARSSRSAGFSLALARGHLHAEQRSDRCELARDRAAGACAILRRARP